MAVIPVTKKSGGALWLWLLLALLGVAVIWWLLSRADDDAEVAELEPAPAVALAPVSPVGPPAGEVVEPAGGAALTSLDGIFAEDAAGLIGRDVRLDDVRVTAMAGDRTFWVGEDPRLFVVLNEVPTPGTPVEGRYDIDAGQVVDLTGAIRSPTDPVLRAPVEGLPADQRFVLYAQAATIESRP